MCGICGFIQDRPIRPDAVEVIVAMRDEMVHRGPDGAGLRLGNTYALGHRRLSIVDLSDAGRQPMSNEDGRVWISFNGEIYNHAESRAQLEGRGHVFESQTDTEVIVHGWEEWGETVVDRLNGMFAFCIVDERRKVSFLARDRMGIKPLYYFETPDTFAFASEVKALLRHPACPRSIRTDVLGEYLLFRHVAGARTPFEGVYELPPGSHLTIDRSLRVRVHQYWSVQGPPPEDDIQEELTPVVFLERLDTSVGLRMMSDVPLGTQLSGGLDSSVVTALASKRSLVPLKTFSIGFREAEYNELEYSARAAERIGTHHHPFIVDAADFQHELDQMVRFMDVPIDHPNSIFLHLLCKRAKPDVTVLLTGEGADELLAGYERYAYYDHVQRKVRRIPRSILGLFRYVPDRRPHGKLGTLRDWARYGPYGMAIRNGAFGDRALVSMLSGDLALDLGERERLIEGYLGDTPMDALLRLDQQVYLGSILHRQDRVSMGASVEARVPFLDHTLVESANRLRMSAKLDRDDGKRILKRAARGLIPDDVITRRKMGFPVPIEEWFRGHGPLSQRLDLLRDSNGLVGQLLDRPGAATLIDDHRSGRRNNAEDLWILLSLEMWHRAFFRSHAAPAWRSIL